MVQETPGRSVAVTGSLLAAAAVLWAALVAVLVFVVPRYENAFRARSVRLPAPTAWAVAAGRWAEAYWYVLPRFGLLVLPPVILLSWLLRHRARESLAGRLWLGALLGIPVLLQVGIWWALLLP
jgi:type II secretory pathway component PulF